MPAPMVIGLDIGTSGCKAVAVDAHLRTVASATATYRLHAPQSHLAEQDVQEVWRGTVGCLEELAGQVEGRCVGGLSLSGAMHSLLPVGRRGKPLTRAWTWADARCATLARSLRQSPHGPRLYRRTGCPVQAMYHPARLRWIRRNQRELWFQKPLWVGIKDWILHQLTGQWATDWPTASATGLLNLRQRNWDGLALDLAGVAADQLPPPVAPTTVIGGLVAGVAGKLGWAGGLPVIAGGSDGALANIGAGAVGDGQVVATVGTSGALRRLTPAPRLDPQARTWCYVLDGQHYLAGGAINNGGLALQWIHDRLFADRGGFSALFREAARIKPGADGLILLPYFTGERCPHWQPQARAAWLGLTLAHQRGHLARAAMEAVAFCLRDVWELVRDRQEKTRLLRLTGGITQSPLWCQILADVLDVPLVPLQGADASALGAAMIGHVALNQACDLASLAEQVRLPKTRYRPQAPNRAIYRQGHRRFQDLFPAAAGGIRPGFGYIA